MLRALTIWTLPLLRDGTILKGLRGGSVRDTFVFDVVEVVFMSVVRKKASGSWWAFFCKPLFVENHSGRAD